jgi:hypothetical protein
VTPNDFQDPDTGPNDLQNLPVLASAMVAGGNMTIVGALSSIPNSTFQLEFFGNSQCDPSGYGEGETFLVLQRYARHK